MRSSKGKKQGKFMQIIVAPIKILGKARDFYMTGIEDCAGRVSNCTAVGCPSGQAIMRLPKNFNVNSLEACDIDVELIQVLRGTSTRNFGIKLKETRQTAALQTNTEMGRNYSVGVGKFGKIDEDRPCAFKGETGFPFIVSKKGKSCG